MTKARLSAATIKLVNNLGDALFHKGDPVWVIQADGSQRAAEYVGQGATTAWFGGPPQVIVVYPDTDTGEAVEVDRITARHRRDR